MTDLTYEKILAAQKLFDELPPNECAHEGATTEILEGVEKFNCPHCHLHGYVNAEDFKRITDEIRNALPGDFEHRVEEAYKKFLLTGQVEIIIK